MRPHVTLTPYIVIAVGIMAVSTASLFIRFAQQEAHSLTIAAFRLGLASLILIPITSWKQSAAIRAVSRRDWLLTGASGMLLAVHFATWIQSLAYTSIASSIVLVATMPVWVALLAPIILKEPLTRFVIYGLGITTLGTLIVGLADSCSSLLELVCPPFNQLWSTNELTGNFLALIGALSGAGYILIGREVRQRMAILPYITIVYSVSALALISFAVATKQNLIGLSPPTYIWMVLLAIVPQLIGHSSFNYALGKLPASFVSVTLLGEPLGAMLLAYIFLGEQPGYVKGVGAILIFAGIIIASSQSTPKEVS